MLWFYVEAARRPPPATCCPPPAVRNGVNVITKKPRDGLFSNLVYTLVVLVSWPDLLFKVVGQRSRSQRQKMMWFFRHFWIFISYHIFLLNQVEGAIAIPPSNSAPPATLLSVRLSVRLSVNRSVNHIFRFLHICWQVTGKEWHRVRNADVSRWLTLGQHRCRWVLLSFHAFVCPSNHPWAWVCVLHTKRLEEMAYNLACWCIQMAYTQHSWMLMDIVVGLSVRPSVRLFVYGIFRWLCICWQITWNKWHKIWHADVSPSLISLSQHWC